MASSTLSLTVDKGPKEGETLACNPGTVIRIGRMVRGNTLAIKDPGISQKHLTICFLPEISRWVLTDLGSSNGTHINGSLIPPEEPSSLSDGDVIKIGERTCISVTISRCDLPPRGPKEAKLEEKAWESKNGQRGRGKGRKGGGSTRVSRKDGALESVLVEPRVTRSLARGGSIRVFVKKLKEEDVMIMSSSDFVGAMEKERQSRENYVGVEEEVVAVDGENDSRVEEVKNNVDATSKGNNDIVEEEVEDNMDSISKENNAGVEEEVLTLDGENINSKVEDNMNNMTLGEWFDRMEEYLPKAINKVAEEIIAKLRDKAHLFDEYVSQTPNVLVE